MKTSVLLQLTINMAQSSQPAQPGYPPMAYAQQSQPILMANEMITITGAVTGQVLPPVTTNTPWVADNFSPEALALINERLADVGMVLSKI